MSFRFPLISHGLRESHSAPRGNNPQSPTPEQRAATRAADLLRNTNCSNFISELISIAAGVAGQPWRGLITPSFAPLLANANGDLEPSYQGRSGRSGDVTTYGTTTNNNTIAWNREFYGLRLDDQALMTLHESLHLIPNFSDFAVAGAAHIMATRGRNNPGNVGTLEIRPLPQNISTNKSQRIADREVSSHA
jgi:hypothetical protein